MADLGKSNTEWYRFWARFVFILAIFRSLDFFARRFGDESRTNLKKTGASTTGYANFGGTLPEHLTIDGLKLGTWTTEDGRIIIRTTGAGPFTVTAYRATGGGAGDRLCAGAGAAGATVALAELNGSGVTMTYKLSGAPAADTTDTETWKVQQDWRLAARNLFDGTDDEGEDGSSLQAIVAVLTAMYANLIAARDLSVTALEQLMIAAPGNVRAYGSKFLGEEFSSLLTETATVNGGKVERLRSGALVSLARAARDETTGSTQTFRERLVEAAAAVPDVNNDGKLTIAGVDCEAHARAGRLRWVCVRGKGQGLPTATQKEQLAVYFADAGRSDLTKRFTRDATVGSYYKGEDGQGAGDGFLPERVYTKTGDDDDEQIADVATGFGASGETLLNTSAGVAHCTVVETSPGLFRFDWYSEEERENLVAQSNSVAADAPWTADPVGSSGLSLHGTAGSAPTDEAEFSVDCNFLSAQQADGEGADTWTQEVTETAAGETSRTLAKMPIFRDNGYKFEGVPSAELIDDDLIKSNGDVDTFGEFAA
jgi:hypothetical protein